MGIDNGGGSIKAGVGISKRPQSTIHSIVGHPKKAEIGFSDTFFGEQAQMKNEISNNNVLLSRPIEHGLITHWEDMTKLWRHIFHEQLDCADDVENSHIMLSEAPLTPKLQREKSAQIMFETFNVSGYHSKNTAVLELYSHGHTTGMVVGSGFDSTYTVPIYQGYALAHASRKMEFGGDTINQQLLKLLHAQHFSFGGLSSQTEVLEHMKRQKCYVSAEFEAELKQKDSALWKMANANTAKYALPDGHEVHLGSNRFEAAEVFFQPRLMGGHRARKCSSVCDAALQSLYALNMDLRMEVVPRLCLAGGGTLLNGFAERFGKDLRAMVPASMKLQIHTKEGREYAAYIGASLFTTMSSFKEAVVTQDEYEECGPKIVHRKCF